MLSCSLLSFVFTFVLRLMIQSPWYHFSQFFVVYQQIYSKKRTHLWYIENLCNSISFPLPPHVFLSSLYLSSLAAFPFFLTYFICISFAPLFSNLLQMSRFSFTYPPLPSKPILVSFVGLSHVLLAVLFPFHIVPFILICIMFLLLLSFCLPFHIVTFADLFLCRPALFLIFVFLLLTLSNLLHVPYSSSFFPSFFFPSHTVLFVDLFHVLLAVFFIFFLYHLVPFADRFHVPPALLLLYIFTSQKVLFFLLFSFFFRSFSFLLTLSYLLICSMFFLLFSFFFLYHLVPFADRFLFLLHSYLLHVPYSSCFPPSFFFPSHTVSFFDLFHVLLADRSPLSLCICSTFFSLFY